MKLGYYAFLMDSAHVVSILPGTAPTAASLTARLRHDLAPLHAAIETAGDLPARIRTLADYQSCLAMFHAIFAPLEQALGACDFAALDLDFDMFRRTHLLTADLVALDAPPPVLPRGHDQIATTAEALGILYVLTGSALGGKVILAGIQAQLGPAVAGATRFFEWQGQHTGRLWLHLKSVIDRHGEAAPAERHLVQAGARHCYGKFAAAMASHAA